MMKWLAKMVFCILCGAAAMILWNVAVESFDWLSDDRWWSGWAAGAGAWNALRWFESRYEQ